MSIKSFTTEVVLSLYTGVSFGSELSPFDKVHELAEHVMGHPIWTHEFAEKSLWDRMSANLEEEFPKLKELGPLDLPKHDKTLILPVIQGYLANAKALLGDTMTFSSGGEERTESPIDSLERIAPNKTIISVILPGKEDGNR